VEFALASIVLVPMLLGTFSFGLAMRDYNTLQTNVRHAARFASLQDYDSTTNVPSDAYLQAVRNMVVYGNPAGSGSAMLQGLTPQNVLVTIEMRAGVPYQVTVSVVNFQLVDFFEPITLNGKPTVTFPYMGRFTPPT
jgi:Flp pilus assembly protein TadG